MEPGGGKNNAYIKKAKFSHKSKGVQTSYMSLVRIASHVHFAAEKLGNLTL